MMRKWNSKVLRLFFGWPEDCFERAGYFSYMRTYETPKKYLIDAKDAYEQIADSCA